MGIPALRAARIVGGRIELVATGGAAAPVGNTLDLESQTIDADIDDKLFKKRNLVRGN